MTAGRVRFRRYTGTDCDGVWTAFRETSAQLGFEVGPWNDDLLHIEDRYLSQSGAFLVGEIDGRIVAFGGLQQVSPGRARVRRVGVLPAMQRRGIGRALMVELEAVAVRGGIRVLELDTSLAQTAARALYASCGCPERGQVVLGGVTCVEFEKELGGV